MIAVDNSIEFPVFTLSDQQQPPAVLKFRENIVAIWAVFPEFQGVFFDDIGRHRGLLKLMKNYPF